MLDYRTRTPSPHAWRDATSLCPCQERRAYSPCVRWRSTATPPQQVTGDPKIIKQGQQALKTSVVSAGENLALQGKAAQSSLYEYGFAYNAIDGSHDSTWEHGSCSHTSNDINPWWRLDLRKTHRVFSVNITNMDTNPERLDGAEIRIGDSLENNGNANPR